jgi:hypothetical protein
MISTCAIVSANMEEDSDYEGEIKIDASMKTKKKAGGGNTTTKEAVVSKKRKTAHASSSNDPHGGVMRMDEEDFMMGSGTHNWGGNQAS